MKVGDRVRIGLLNRSDYIDSDLGWNAEMAYIQGEEGFVKGFCHGAVVVEINEEERTWWLWPQDVSLADKFLVECPFCGNELDIPLTAGKIEVIEDDVEAHGCGELFAVIVTTEGDVRKQWKLVEAAPLREVKDV